MCAYQSVTLYWFLILATSQVLPHCMSNFCTNNISYTLRHLYFLASCCRDCFAFLFFFYLRVWALREWWSRIMLLHMLPITFKSGDFDGHSIHFSSPDTKRQSEPLWHRVVCSLSSFRSSARTCVLWLFQSNDLVVMTTVFLVLYWSRSFMRSSCSRTVGLKLNTDYLASSSTRSFSFYALYFSL